MHCILGYIAHLHFLFQENSSQPGRSADGKRSSGSGSAKHHHVTHHVKESEKSDDERDAVEMFGGGEEGKRLASTLAKLRLAYKKGQDYEAREKLERERREAEDTDTEH